MKVIKNILIVVLLVFITVYVALYAFLAVQGKRIITDIARITLGRQATIGSVRMSGVLSFKIVDVKIDGIGKAASIDVSPSILALMTGKVVLYTIEVTKPELTYSNPNIQPAGSSAGASVPAQHASGKAAPSRQMTLVFHRLRIVDGVFNYIDQAVASDNGGIKITATNLDATITNTYQFPNEIVTKFALTADIPWKDSSEKGAVKLDGWMNYDKKDMRAMLVMSDIDALYLYPYYSSWFSLDKANIQKAKLAFTSNVTGLNNDVSAACHLELTELSFKQREEQTDQTRSERIAQKVLQFFKAMNNGKVNLDFTVRTKMDSPEFGLNCIKNAFYHTLDEARKGQESTASKVMQVPGQVVGGTVKGVGQVSSALIGGIASFGKEIGRSLKASFSKEPVVSDTAAEPSVSKQVEQAAVTQETSVAVTEPVADTQQHQAAEPAMNETANNTTGQ